MSLSELVAARRVIVCVGSGGVGKTTTAAAIAVHAASQGRKALVLTIDPARRLANSLGLEMLGNEERLVPAEKFEGAGLPLRGSLHAMMLDTKRTFDDLVARYAPNPKQRDKILANPFYQRLAGTLAGSQEYMAMEKLHEVMRERDYELIVLDTPPTAHALDFLDAPKRMIALLDTPVLRSLPRIAGGFSKRAFFGSGLLLGQLGKFTGLEFFQNLAEFMGNFSEMFDGFAARARKIYEGLQGPEVSFLLVTSPAALTIQEALFFFEKLRDAQMPFGGFIINRVNQHIGGGCGEVAVSAVLERLYQERSIQAIPRDSLQNILTKLCHNLSESEVLATIDRQSVNRLKEAAGQVPLYVEVPRFTHDIYDLGGLAEVGAHLFDDGREAAAAAVAPGG